MWDRHPTPDELLDARLAAGWQPTPSLLADGERVLGHAACRVPPSHLDAREAPRAK